MSGELKKPQITRAGKTSEATAVVEKEKSRAENRKIARQAEAKKRKTAKQAKAQQKRDKKTAKQQAKLAKRKSRNNQSGSQSFQGIPLETTEVKPEVTKGHTLATETKKSESSKSKKQVKKDKKKSKKVLKAKKVRSSRRLPKKSKLAMIGGVAAVLLLVGYGIAKDEPVGFVSSDSTTSSLLGDSDVTAGPIPDFVTVKPLTDGGRLRSNFDSDKKFFGFQEEFDGKLITVSQAQVPSDYEFDLDTLLQTTEYTSAARIESSKGVVYILVSDSSTLQQALFKYNNSLVSIYSPDGFSNLQWVEYIDSL